LCCNRYLKEGRYLENDYFYFLNPFSNPITIIMKHLLPVIGIILLCLSATNSSAQFEVTFDDSDLLLPGPGMDYTRTIDTGDYQFRIDDYNNTTFYGRKEADSSYHGFTYSNVSDSTTPGMTNDRAAFPAVGASGSAQYAVAHGTDYGIYLEPYIGAKATRLTFVYQVSVTNATITVLSMEQGDSTAKKFGGADGTDPDWLLLTINGHKYGDTTVRSVAVYLADYRSDDSTEDYIVKDWRQVDLSDLGRVDSLSFSLTSSDTGINGMNTPAYFCIDDLNLELLGGIEGNSKNTLQASIYPNPSNGMIHIDAGVATDAKVYDMAGRLLVSKEHVRSLDASGWPPGIYLVRIAERKGDRSAAFSFYRKP
jgi:hypothetical protein